MRDSVLLTVLSNGTLVGLTLLTVGVDCWFVALGGGQLIGCVNKVPRGTVRLTTDVVVTSRLRSFSEYKCNRLLGVMLRYCLRLDGLNTATYRANIET